MVPLHIGRLVSRPTIAVFYACALLLVLSFPARVHGGGEQAYQADQTYQPGRPAEEAPAHIALIDGSATIDRDGQSQPANPNAPFVPGDRLRTTAGRVEVLFPDGSALDVDQYTAVDLQSPTLIRLDGGRVLLVVAGAGDPASAVHYQIDTPVASAETQAAGEYRVAVLPALNDRGGPETELAVLRGFGSLATERGSMPVRAGERSVARDSEAPLVPQAFNSARFDAFDRWAAARRDERTGSSVSSAYLPRDLHVYGGTLERYGSWEDTPEYGHVWYPSVAADWRPYYYGYWAPYQPWGWTWIGVDYWSWPTHHFGSWGFARSRWFWIPGRTWSPAWVAWGEAPGFVSWCPLGFDRRPVFAYSHGFARRWDGWTVVPQHSFGLAARIDSFAVSPRLLPASTEFVARRTAPIAVPRARGELVRTGAAAGVAVLRQNPGNIRTPGNVAVQPGAGARDQRAIARAPVMAAPAGVHEFKQPLTDRFRSPASAVPRERMAPAGRLPYSTPQGRPAPAFPRAPDPGPNTVSGRRSYSIVEPHGDARAPQAVPRWSSPRGDAPQRTPTAPRWSSPSSTAAPPARAYQPPPARVDHSYVVPRSYAPMAPQRTPTAPRWSSPSPTAAPPARAYQPPPPRAYQPPSPRMDRPSTPPAQMRQMPLQAVPRGAPAPSAAPRSGGAPPPPPSRAAAPRAESPGRSPSGEARRR